MGIRARLLVLAVGIAVPLALLGAADLSRVWQRPMVIITMQKSN